MTSVALVVLDTLRKDAFDEYFDWVPGMRFERAYSTANWTVPAHASLFTGLYPSEVGTHAKNMQLDYDGDVLAEKLHKNGYATRAYSANTNVTSHFNFDRGFSDFRVPERFKHLNDDRLFDWRDFNKKNTYEGVPKYASALRSCITADCDTFRSLLHGVKMMRSQDSTGVKYGGTIEAISEFSDLDISDDEFLFVNLMEAHEPYEVPADYQSVPNPGMTDSVGDLSFGDENGLQFKKAYDDCAKYLSDIYQKFFNEVLSEFDYVITISDHGELLGEYGGWGHEYGVYPELTHVPLVISGAVQETTKRNPVSLLDVYSTILGITGIEDTSKGTNLLKDIPAEDKLTEYKGLTSWSEQRLLGEFDEKAVEDYNSELRGLVTEDNYYFQTEDGLKDENSETTELDQNIQRRLDEFVQDLDERVVEGKADIPDSVEDQLKDLGYA